MSRCLNSCCGRDKTTMSMYSRNQSRGHVFILLVCFISLIWEVAAGISLRKLNSRAFKPRVSLYTTRGALITCSRSMDSTTSSLTLRASDRDPEVALLGSPKIKLPIVQVLEEGGKLKAEFICGNDVDSSMVKLKAYLSSLVKSSSPSSSATSSSSSGYISNIYSESQLMSELSSLPSNKLIVLKIFRQGCKKCVKMEPMFHELSQDSQLSSFTWIQVQAEYIPDYIGMLKSRLSGATSRAIDNEANGIDCSTCKNTGFVSCTQCQGTGTLVRGENTIFCSSCGGKKMQRCPTCGGKCIACQS